MMRNRRAALDGLSRILEAGAPEDLFSGPEDEAMFLYDLLVDAARARSSSYYWEICRTARRRGVTPEYVVDRAAVLLGAIGERRRSDLYRILGVPPLASAETIRQRWLEIAKRHHPDAGGDGVFFQQANQAYEILRDPARRAEYERFWLRALGPFERVAPREDVPAGGPAHPIVRTWARPGATERGARPLAAAAPAAQAEETPPEIRIEPRAPGSATMDEVIGLFGRVRSALAPIDTEAIVQLQADVAEAIKQVESVGEELRRLAAVKSALG